MENEMLHLSANAFGAGENGQKFFHQHSDLQIPLILPFFFYVVSDQIWRRIEDIPLRHVRAMTGYGSANPVHL